MGENLLESLKSGLSGEYYKAEIPNMLDLITRIELDIKGLIGILDPEEVYASSPTGGR